MGDGWPNDKSRVTNEAWRAGYDRIFGRRQAPAPESAPAPPRAGLVLVTCDDCPLEEPQAIPVASPLAALRCPNCGEGRGTFRFHPVGQASC